MKLDWISPESRFLVKLLFKRNYDTFSRSAQTQTNWIVLGIDVVALWILF